MYSAQDFSDDELMAIVEDKDGTVPPRPWSADAIVRNTNQMMAHFQAQQDDTMVQFARDAQTRLLRAVHEDEEDESTAETGTNTNTKKNENENENEVQARQTDQWFRYQALPQNNATQRNKNTNRVQKIDVYDNAHVPMNREQLGVADQYSVPVKQDTLNPRLENVTKRFINLDSQFRPVSSDPEEGATDYTLDLSDPLRNVLNLRLYSFQIPYTWYVFDAALGNTRMWVHVPPATEPWPIVLPDGNYSPAEFCEVLQQAALDAGFTPPDPPLDDLPLCSYRSSNGKLTLNFQQWKDPNGVVIEGGDDDDDDVGAWLDWVEPTVDSCAALQFPLDGTLGWFMGFREPATRVRAMGNPAPFVFQWSGPKYLIVVLDDFNQNHLNSGLITITEPSRTLAVPSYFNTSQPYFCTPPIPAAASLADSRAVPTTQRSVMQVLPSAPRTLTQSQLYTINTILQQNSQTTRMRTTAPTNSDTFALIPWKGGLSTGAVYVEFSGSLQDNRRDYFGPVDIERMRVRLLDDRGNVVQLHGANWSFTLICECLYQY